MYSRTQSPRTVGKTQQSSHKLAKSKKQFTKQEFQYTRFTYLAFQMQSYFVDKLLINHHHHHHHYYYYYYYYFLRPLWKVNRVTLWYKKSRTLYTFVVEIGLRDAILEIRPAFVSCYLARMHSRPSNISVLAASHIGNECERFPDCWSKLELLIWRQVEWMLPIHG